MPAGITDATEIAGNEMTIEPASDAANSFMILWNDEQAAQDLLDAIDGSSDDIDVVFSYPSGDTHPNRVIVDGYRVAGADGTPLRDGFAENYRAYLAEFTSVSVSAQDHDGVDHRVKEHCWIDAACPDHQAGARSAEH